MKHLLIIVFIFISIIPHCVQAIDRSVVPHRAVVSLKSGELLVGRISAMQDSGLIISNEIEERTVPIDKISAITVRLLTGFKWEFAGALIGVWGGLLLGGPQHNEGYFYSGNDAIAYTFLMLLGGEIGFGIGALIDAVLPASNDEYVFNGSHEDAMANEQHLRFALLGKQHPVSLGFHMGWGIRRPLNALEKTLSVNNYSISNGAYDFSNNNFYTGDGDATPFCFLRRAEVMFRITPRIDLGITYVNVSDQGITGDSGTPHNVGYYTHVFAAGSVTGAGWFATGRWHAFSGDAPIPGDLVFGAGLGIASSTGRRYVMIDSGTISSTINPTHATISLSNESGSTTAIASMATVDWSLPISNACCLGFSADVMLTSGPNIIGSSATWLPGLNGMLLSTNVGIVMSVRP